MAYFVLHLQASGLAEHEQDLFAGSLGKVSAGWLIDAGISCAEELVEVGAVRAYLRVQSLSGVDPGMNLLYALVGAIEDRPWQEVARIEKGRLLSELESYREMDRLFDDSES